MDDAQRYRRWLALTALAYALAHHLGSLPDGLGAGPDHTRWADWLDLLVPYAVLVPAAATLHAARVTPRTWAVAALGASLYLSGHGIHLAANSVGNAEPGPTAHLWDELVGHAIWYAGVAIVAAVLATTMRGRPRPSVIGVLLAVAVGATWGTNAVGGHAWWLALPSAVLACGWGWRQRSGLGVLLLVAGLATLVVLTFSGA